MVHANVVVVANYFLAAFLDPWTGWLAALTVVAVCTLMCSGYRSCKTAVGHALAAACGLAAVALGASDAHAPDLVGRAYTETRLPAGDPVTVPALLEAVRDGRVRPAGGTAPRRSDVGKLVRIVGGVPAALSPSARSRSRH